MPRPERRALCAAQKDRSTEEGGKEVALEGLWWSGTWSRPLQWRLAAGREGWQEPMSPTPWWHPSHSQTKAAKSKGETRAL